MSGHVHDSDCIADALERIADRLDEMAALPRPVVPDEPPLIDGCRIVHRGDGFDVCKVHSRYWKSGTEKCPGSQRQ